MTNRCNSIKMHPQRNERRVKYRNVGLHETTKVFQNTSRIDSVPWITAPLSTLSIFHLRFLAAFAPFNILSLIWILSSYLLSFVYSLIPPFTSFISSFLPSLFPSFPQPPFVPSNRTNFLPFFFPSLFPFCVTSFFYPFLPSYPIFLCSFLSSFLSFFNPSFLSFLSPFRPSFFPSNFLYLRSFLLHLLSPFIHFRVSFPSFLI